MTNSTHTYPLKDEEPDTIHHASFILRCWTDEAREMRARLIDVRSGISYPLTDLAGLPALVRRLVTETVPTEPPTNAKRS